MKNFAETYKVLSDLLQADKLAAGFLNIGLERGDRVAIWSPNYEFWYISMLAIARAGLVCVSSKI
jgi:fatty-acyl-CoA synthase